MGVYSDTPVVYLRHSEIDGEAVVADLPGVVEDYEARGWVRGDSIPAHLDPDAPNVGVPHQPDLDETPEVEPAVDGETPEAAEPPPKKRARKAEPEAESATTTTEEGDVNG